MRKWLLGILAVMMVVSVASAQVTAIHDIQYVEDPADNDASPMLDQTVTVEAWVTFEPGSWKDLVNDYDGNRFHVADAAGAWNGIYVYASGQDLNMGFGWKVRVTGTVTEYWGLTEIEIGENGTIEVLDDQVDWEGDLPAACAYTTITADQLGSVATGEQYESVLVQIDDVVTIGLPDGDDQDSWTVEDDNENVVTINKPTNSSFGYYHKVEVDKPFTYVRGVVYYTHSKYRLLPEIAYDLRVEEVANTWYTPIAYFQQVRPMDMTVRDDGTGNLDANDWSYAAQQRYNHDLSTGDPTDYQWLVENSQIVTIRGRVTMPTGLSYAGDGIKVIVSDSEPGVESEPWSAILSYNSDAASYPNMYVGDDVTMAGFIAEYETAPARMTEMFITEPVTVHSANNDIPLPAVVTVADMRDTKIAERWGNVYVKMYDVIVARNEYQYEPMSLTDDPETPDFNVKLDDDSNWNRDDVESPAYQDWQDYIVPPVNSVIDSVTGWVYHHFGTYDTEVDDWVYKVCPDYPADIVIGEGPPTIISVTRDYATPGADQEVLVTANVTDNNEVSTVNLMYKVGDEGDFQTVAMTHSDTEDLVWTGTIPGQDLGSLIWYYVEATDDLDQSSTAPSDIAADLYGYWAQEELGVYQVQYTPFSGGSSPYAGMQVTVSGTVVSTNANALRYVSNSSSDHAEPAYFIQSGEDTPFSGLLVHIPATVVPDGFNSGDNITVTGTVDEAGGDWNYKYGGNTRIYQVVSAELNGPGSYSAHAVTTEDVVDAAEEYESVFVEFSNVEITSVNSYDWSFTDDSGETFRLDDDMIHTGTDATGDETIDATVTAWLASLEVGSTIPNLFGIVTYSFGTWKVEIRGWMDISSATAPGDGYEARPIEFALEPVYPNPFNPSTTVQFSIPNSSNVKLTIFNALGQKVVSLIDGQMKAGYHTAFWNGHDANDMPVTSGMYFLRLSSENHVQVQKMMLLK